MMTLFTVNAHVKLQVLEQYPITLIRRRERESVLTAADESANISLNSFLGFLGIGALHFCSFYCTHIQPMIPSTKVPFLASQANA